MSDPRLPVTLLTGFLGAGKTTLLNAVLADTSHGRIAVIVNEFGEAGLDHDLIEGVTDEVTLMRSGCLCCSVRGELSETIARLIERRASGELSFERVVIETTGLADPGPILQTLRTDAFLSRSTRMDGVVTVADAVNGAATLDAQFEAISQAAMADLIVLSKTDIAPPERVQAIEARLRALNPGATLIHAPRGQGVPGRFWSQSSLREDATPTDILAWTNATPKPVDPLMNLAGMTPSKPTLAVAMSPHDDRIITASVVVDHALDDEVFDEWLNGLISLRGANILRAKGILFLKDIPYPFVFHGVQNVFDDPVPLRNWTGPDRRSRIVIIAKDVRQRRLQSDLDMLRTRAIDGNKKTSKQA